jgi:hypothetical protein
VTGSLSTIGWRIGAALLPGVVGGLGLRTNIGDWESATTIGQKVAGLGVIVYGPIGVAAAVMLLLGRKIGKPLLIAFSVAASLVGGLAPVVWGDASPMYGILSGFSSALLCGAALWMANNALGLGLDAAPTSG